MTSCWIDIPSPDGGTFGGYLALPPTGSGPGIVLVQEIFGVNHHIRAVADQYALDGYVVLAPDVFWRDAPRVEFGYGEQDFGKGFALLRKTDFSKAAADLAAGAKTLRARPECAGRVGIVGYCMGGLLSYLVAATGAVDAAVAYYGGGIADHLDRASQVKCPMLFHFAELDQHITRDNVEAVKRAFTGRDDATVRTYPGVDHGFNCWARPMYNQRAAALAHGRSLEFLSQHLG
jgi:carboxymethylenebutenolidase